MTPCIESRRTPASLYPRLIHKGRQVLESRYVWEQTHGPIPDGFYVCHRCDNPRCIRLDHLFLGTPSDNVRDAVRKGRDRQSKKTHCPAGHPYTPENTYRRPSAPHKRQCVTCRREKNEIRTQARRTGTRQAVA